MNIIDQNHSVQLGNPAHLLGQFDEAHDFVESDQRFKNLMKKRDWEKLPDAIKRRFSKRIKRGQSIAYQGRVSVMRMNPIGRALASIARIIGAPLPYDASCEGRSAVVIVTEDQGAHGQYWIRQYNRANGFPQTVGSSKRFSGPTGLEEYIGYGIAMSLRLEASARELRFVADRFFLKLGNLRVLLPKFLEPGRLVIGHRELGHGYFLFSLDLRHPLLGELIHQEAVFHDAQVMKG